MAQLSKATLLLLTAWRRAGRGEKVEIECGEPRHAARLRMNLYNAIRPVKTGALVDEEVREAAENCSIVIDGSLLRIVQKLDTPIMQALADGLGIDGAVTGLPPADFPGVGRLPTDLRMTLTNPIFTAAGPQTPEEAEVAKSLARVQKLLQEGGQEVETGRVTPYYRRED